MLRANSTQVASQGQQKGLSLIELMIAMMLGLVVVGGVIGIILANGQTYRSGEALGQIQESARTSFELLARDIREAGSPLCANADRVANVLNGTVWWRDWAGIRGYAGDEISPAAGFGTGSSPASGSRVPGTEAIYLQGVEGPVGWIDSHVSSGSDLKLTLKEIIPFANGDILMACDYGHEVLFQASAVDGKDIGYEANSTGYSPGNCSAGLGYPTICTEEGTNHTFSNNGQIARLSAVTWFIGNNGRPEEGGRSLYRARLANGGNVQIEEIIPGVKDMALRYRKGADETLTASPAATEWSDVNAVEITLVMDSAAKRVSTDENVNDGRLSREFTTLIGLRSRTR